MTQAQAEAGIRRGRKFAQVVEGARAVFMSAGFEGASVDEIARRAGVSKATLYSYFPDKRLLFMEVFRRECQRQADEALELIDISAPPEQVLPAAARRIVDFFTSSFGRGVHRICVAESARFPDLGRRFYESGPEMARARVAEYLRGACARGQLAIDDVELAADQFIKLCEADLLDRVTCRVQTEFTEAEIARVVDGAVKMFLARYGTAKT
ncbi:TetR/AcrR family transcriptional regulator [Rhodobacteraceae bacterium WD3A24]|nr:TetR/AcrR family transcriptional regulator [Rhodobacteraceae bacterium WD3A24]